MAGKHKAAEIKNVNWKPEELKRLIEEVTKNGKVKA